MKALELTGKRFGNITVIRRADNTKDGKTQWLCRCDCGKEWVVQAGNLNWEEWIEDAETVVYNLPTIEVSEDAISRAEAIECISELPLDEVIIKQALKTLPSVVPSRAEGEWIKRSSVGNWECSLCGSDVIASEQKLANYNWCPSCGAKMKGADYE